MTDFTALAQRYVAVFNATHPDARRELIAGVFAPDVRYTDPHADVAGHDGIEAFVAAARERLPGFAFAVHGAVDAHHDVARFQWAAGPAGVEAPVIGFDVVVVDGEGRIAQVHGFLDRVPAAA